MRGRRLMALLLGAALLPGAVLAGCGRDTPAIPGAEAVATTDREAMPPLAGTTLDGDTLDLASMRGSVVVLNSWASWCEPCREEMPALAALAASDPSIHVVGLNVRDDPAAAREFARGLGVGFPSIVDADGSLLRTIPGVPPAALPSTVILDAQGRIAARIIGPASPEQLRELVGSA